MVIAPTKLHDVVKGKNVKSYGTEACTVLRPKHLSFSNKSILGFNTIRLTSFFLNNLPIVIASGESSYSHWDLFPASVKEELKNQTKHIFCVSESNKARLMKLGFNEKLMTVVPNAVDYSLFRPMNKAACKQKIGLKEDDFVVGFVGHFIERKGPNRVIQAIKALNDKDIKLVCVGKGGALESNDFTIELPPVPNNQLPELFNAFDVFVLPTLHEGHCNVIEEAKACGIPVVSSKGTSVEKQLSANEGMLINPNDIGEISDAIAKLKGDKELLSFYARNLIENDKGYDIQKRSNKILALNSDNNRNTHVMG